MKTKDPICPECRGSKGETIAYVNDGSSPLRYVSMKHFKPCWYCAGTGFASDEDIEVEFWREG